MCRHGVIFTNGPNPVLTKEFGFGGDDHFSGDGDDDFEDYSDDTDDDGGDENDDYNTGDI